MLIRKCVLENSSYFYMRVSNVKIKILQKILKQKNSKNLLVNLEINIKYCPTNLRLASFGTVEPQTRSFFAHILDCNMQPSPLLWIFDFSNTIAANWHYFYPTLFPQLTICNSESLPIVGILSTEFFLENLRTLRKIVNIML